MTDVDPIIALLGAGGPIDSLESLIDRFSNLELIVYQLRERTGGSEDLVEQLEVTSTTEDGGNRAMIRRYRDDIEEIRDNLASLQKPRDFSQEIQDLSDQVAQIKRLVNRDETQDLIGQVSDLKRRNRHLENLVIELSDSVSTVKKISTSTKQTVFSIEEQTNLNKRLTKSVEQKVYDLEGRIDDGT